MANQIDHVFTCPILKSGKPSAPSTCIQAFAKAHHMEVVKTVADGDCFFDSLLLSRAIPLPAGIKGVAAQRQYLRDALVDYMLDHIDPSIMPAERIEELYQAGMYACDAGDLVPVYAPAAFGIQLHLYDLHREPSGHYLIMRYRTGAEGPVVSVLRAGEHFRLLRTTAVNHLTEEMKKLNVREAPRESLAANMALAKRLAQENLNANLAQRLAQENRNANLARRLAQEAENAAYAASLQGGRRRAKGRKATRRAKSTRPKTRRR